MFYIKFRGISYEILVHALENETKVQLIKQ